MMIALVGRFKFLIIVLKGHQEHFLSKALVTMLGVEHR